MPIGIISGRRKTCEEELDGCEMVVMILVVERFNQQVGSDACIVEDKLVESMTDDSIMRNAAMYSISLEGGRRRPHFQRTHGRLTKVLIPYRIYLLPQTAAHTEREERRTYS